MIAREGEGELVVDLTGSAPGRGSYCHLQPGCLLDAKAIAALSRSIRRGQSKIVPPRMMIELLREAIELKQGKKKQSEMMEMRNRILRMLKDLERDAGSVRRSSSKPKFIV